jgi:hypothetical protein
MSQVEKIGTIHFIFTFLTNFTSASPETQVSPSLSMSRILLQLMPPKYSANQNTALQHGKRATLEIPGGDRYGQRTDAEALYDLDPLENERFTFYVRRPDLYKEEYMVAERAFKEGGWVYMGQVVHWTTIPEDEVKRPQRAIVKRAKNDAIMDGIEYVPDAGLEHVESEAEDDVQQDGGVQAGNSEEDDEDEEVEEGGENDSEEEDDEADEDYDDGNKRKGKKRRRYSSDEGEDSKQKPRKPSHVRSKIFQPRSQSASEN